LTGGDVIVYNGLAYFDKYVPQYRKIGAIKNNRKTCYKKEIFFIASSESITKVKRLNTDKVYLGYRSKLR